MVSVHQALQGVEEIKAGRLAARDPEPIGPVSEEHVEMTLPLVSKQVTAMIRLQLLSGARPGEITSLRPCDVTITTDDVWVYRPESHKTEHHGRERRIYLGPKAQAIITPFLRAREGPIDSAPKASGSWSLLLNSSRGGHRPELSLIRSGVQQETYRLELAQVDGENPCHGRVLP